MPAHKHCQLFGHDLGQFLESCASNQKRTIRVVQWSNWVFATQERKEESKKARTPPYQGLVQCLNWVFATQQRKTERLVFFLGGLFLFLRKCHCFADVHVWAPYVRVSLMELAIKWRNSTALNVMMIKGQNFSEFASVTLFWGAFCGHHFTHNSHPFDWYLDLPILDRRVIERRVTESTILVSEYHIRQIISLSQAKCDIRNLLIKNGVLAKECKGVTTNKMRRSWQGPWAVLWLYFEH